MTARCIRFALAAFAALAFCAAAQAQVSEKDLGSGKAKIDPAKGYIFIHGDTRQAGWFFREPTQKDLDDYKSDWEKAFAKARKNYERALENYPNDLKFAQEHHTRLPTKPEEVTRENFTVGPIEFRLGSGFGPQFAYSKGDGYYSYLAVVEPGTYTYYGPVLLDPSKGMTGVCDCMGSFRFEVKAGRITNLGDFLLQHWASEEQLRLSGVDVQKPAWTPTPADYSLPATLSAYPSEQADLHAAGKMNNFYGIRIARFPPIPGVLGYERDRVIDLRAKAEENRPAEAAARTPDDATQASDRNTAEPDGQPTGG